MATLTSDTGGGKAADTTAAAAVAEKDKKIRALEEEVARLKERERQLLNQIS